MGSGRVNQAFVGALTSVLKDYYIFVAQLERQHRLGQLTLNKVNNFFRKFIIILAFKESLCLQSVS
jgi:hypothetical protein